MARSSSGQHCATLCTSGFIDDVTFGRNEHDAERWRQHSATSINYVRDRGGVWCLWLLAVFVFVANYFAWIVFLCLISIKFVLCWFLSATPAAIVIAQKMEKWVKMQFYIGLETVSSQDVPMSRLDLVSVSVIYVSCPRSIFGQIVQARIIKQEVQLPQRWRAMRETAIQGHLRSSAVVPIDAALNSYLASIFNRSWDITPSLHIHILPLFQAELQKAAGNRWTWFGFRVPRTLDYSTVN